MNLLSKLRNELDLAFIFVAHDLGVVRHFCDQVAVMYLGKIVEYGDKKKIYELPEHPYTQALLSAAPDINVARGIAPRSASVSSATSRARSTPRAAASARAAGRPRTSARRRSRRSSPRSGRGQPRGRREGGLHLQACHFPEVKTELVAAVEAH